MNLLKLSVLSSTLCLLVVSSLVIIEGTFNKEFKIIIPSLLAGAWLFAGVGVLHKDETK